MNRRAFTLIELLVVIAIIAILAAILFPVFAQAKESAKKAADVSNQKQESLGVIQYQTDYDDLYPLAWGNSDAIAGWPWNYNQYYPHDYPSGPGNDGAGYPIRIQSSPMAWMNSAQPYIKSIGVAETPGAPLVSAGGASNAAVGKSKGKSGLTFNGLLMGYNQSGVEQPADIILLWTGRGKANTDGAILANPALRCPQEAPCVYVPFKANCSPNVNGEQSTMFTTSGTMWIYAKGANTAFCDGHVKFRRLGAQTAATDAIAQAGNGPATDYNVDPYTSYGPTGIPYFFWWDNCHAWLFRPDYVR